MKYSIVIPTYNHCDDLLKPCLESIFKYSDIADVELIISANGCKDNTFEYLGALKDKYTTVGLPDNLKIVWNSAPLGFAKATNAGINVATTNRIVLLNNDAILLPEGKNDWLTTLNSAFENNPQCGISCVLTKHSDVTNRLFAIFFCVMIDRKVFNAIGLLNEEYGVGGHEDTEFSIKAEAAGFEIEQPIPIVWSEEAMLHIGHFPIYHKGEGTVHDPALVSEWTKIFHNNELKLAQKYNPLWYEQHKNDVIL